MAAPEGSDVMVGSARVHYQQWGSTGTPVVLVHGFAESSVSWTPTAELLARSHAVYAVDLAGNGYTDYTGHYTLDDEIDLVSGFITALHLDRPTLVGHSMGAAVVGGVALRQPDMVHGVIFADGDALPFTGQGSGRRVPGWMLRLPYVTTAYRLVTRWSWLSDRLVRAQCGSTCSGVTPDLVAAWMRPLQQGDAERALPQMAGAGVLHLTPDQIRRIDVPRGIIWGAEDTTSGGSLTEAQRNLRQPSTVVLAGAGHLSMVADPTAFAGAVTSIMASWPR